MKLFCCDKGFLVFFLTFGLGICFALLGYQYAPQIEVKKETVLQTLPENSLDEVPKLDCESRGLELFLLDSLFKQRRELETQMLKFDDITEKKEEQKTFEKKIKDLNRQIALVEKDINEVRLKPLKSSQYLSLLTVDNCAEFLIENAPKMSKPKISK